MLFDLAIPLVIVALSAAVLYWLFLRRRRPTPKAD